MNLIRQGFDSLYFAIKTNLPPDTIRELEVVRAIAEETKQPTPFLLNGVDLDVQPFGANGYQYILKGGEFQAKYLFKRPNQRDPWGAFIEIGSLLLTCEGLARSLNLVDETLAALGVAYRDEQVSLNRVDYCIDIEACSFVLDPDCFVAHSRSNIREHLDYQESASANGRSSVRTSCTIGKMPGRQVTAYNKTKEVAAKFKPEWYNIWNAHIRARYGTAAQYLDLSSQVWRIEIRAGKKHLKDSWNMRTFPQFYKSYGDVVRSALEAVRYTIPNPEDPNRARWPNAPIWELAIDACRSDLVEMTTFVPPDLIKEVLRAEQRRMILAQLSGLSVNMAALDGIYPSEVASYCSTLASELEQNFRNDPEGIQEKLNRVHSRYRFT